MNYIQQVDKTFLLIFGISVIIFTCVIVCMLYFVIRYHHTKHKTPVQIEGNLFLEILWTVIPLILVLIMFYYGWEGFRMMRNIPPGAMRIRVIARMWSWTFQYDNGVKSDILKIPAGKPVKLDIISQDVVHSFYVPAFRIKMDAVPGKTNHAWFEAEAPGVYDIFCAEFCGLEHSKMLSEVAALPENEFNDWYRQSKTEMLAGQKLNPGEYALKNRGCLTCHSLDGTKKIGPTLAGIYNRKTKVLTNGKLREVLVDESYIRRSILSPKSDIVEGYKPLMPSQKGVISDTEIKQITEYLKGLKYNVEAN